MSTHNPWVVSALEELGALERRHSERGLDAASAYRVLALLARLENARAAGLAVELPETSRQWGTRVGMGAQGPSPDGLLARLEETLSADDDPFGELLDVLLQVDDAVCVGEFLGRPEAAELARFAAAHVALEPALLGPLGDMADRRLGTLPGSASIRALWETVARSAVEATLDALPPTVNPREALTRQRLLRRLEAHLGTAIHEHLARAPLLEKLLAPAAADVQGPLEPHEGDRVGTYEDEGAVYIQVELPPGREPAGNLELYVSVGEKTAMLSLPIWRRSRRAAIARLDSREELGRRLREAGLPAALEGARFEVVLSLKEAGDER